jgi:hypothetical protein
VRESPVDGGSVELADLASGKVVLCCRDGSYATLVLSAWSRVSPGTQLFWSFTVAVGGMVFSEGGYPVHFEFARWKLSREDAVSWFEAR